MNASTPVRSALHEAAREMAESGVPVFSCKPDSKEPATAHGFKDATCDLTAIDALFSEANYNVAFEPERAGLCVLDIDGEEGEEALAALELAHGLLPTTYEVRTPRGGRHLYFRGSLPPTAGKLGPKIDTRGRSSYVLVAPSVVAGRPYEVKNDIEPAALPSWIAELCEARTDARDAATDVELDQPQDIARANEAANSWPIVREGEGSDNAAYSHACELRDLGASKDKAVEILSAWGERCGFDRDWCEQKVRNAYSYAQNAPGVDHVSTAQEAFGPAIEELKVEEREPATHAVVLRSEATQNARKPPSWLIEGFLPDNGTVALHAPFNSFKSFSATDALMSVASGLPFFGKLAVNRPGPAIYITGEGLSGFETLRRPAWRIARSIPPDTTLPIFTVDGVPQVRSDEDIKRYFEAIASLKQRPSLIVIDPVARAMVGLKENDASDAAVYLNCVEQLARCFRCCVLSVLHEGKDATRDIRGSSAFAAGFDAVWKQEADTDALTAIIRPIKLKDDAGVDPLCIKAKQIVVPGRGKSSLVFDLVPSSEVRSAGRGGVQRSEVGRALQALGAVEGKTVATRVLAHEIAGPDADESVILAKDKNLRRYARDRFRAYVAHLGEGRGDATLWTFAPGSEGESAHA